MSTQSQIGNQQKSIENQGKVQSGSNIQPPSSGLDPRISEGGLDLVNQQNLPNHQISSQSALSNMQNQAAVLSSHAASNDPNQKLMPKIVPTVHSVNQGGIQGMQQPQQQHMMNMLQQYQGQNSQLYNNKQYYGMFPGQVNQGAGVQASYSGMNQMISDQLNSNTLMNAGQSQLQGQFGDNARSLRNQGSRKSNRSQAQKPQFENQLSQLCNNSQASSIPGKSQRILINKKQPFSASQAAKRCFERGKSQNMMGQIGSLTGTSSLSTDTSFSSFAKASTKLKKEQQFQTKQRRFDAKIELKEYFNREPGPGAYQNWTPIEEQQNAESQSKNGFLNGFVSKANRFQQTADMMTVDKNISVGPGQYNPVPVEKNVQAPRLDPKGEFSLPFNEKNPLNYVKPITVNIYFKQSNPGVGYYDPEPVYKNVPGALSVFQSVTNRNQQENTRKIIENQLQPAPGTYDRRDGFDIKYEQRDIGTRNFKHPLPKKIVTVNLHNPHAPPENKKNERPGPASYNIVRDFDAIPETEEGDEDFSVPRFRQVIGGKVYVDDNNDRFGMPIRPMKPIEMKPGPGAYFIEGDGGANNLADKLLPLEDAKTFAQGERDTAKIKTNGNPGPAYYNAQKEPQKISFLFNPAEKFV